MNRPPLRLSSDSPVHTHTVWRNLTVLFGSHLTGLAASLLTVPWLARTLRPEAWGQVLLAQALAAWLVMVIEYAFDLSAARRIADARGRAAINAMSAGPTIPTIVADATSARLMLAAGAVVTWGVAFGYLPALRADWWLATAALVHLLARGLTPLWYFLGTERVSRAVTIDTVGKVMTAVAMVAVVRTPQHGWRVLAVQAAVALVVWLLTHRLLRRECPAAPLSWRGGLCTLRDGFALFVARASGALYMQLNGVLIGVVAAPAAVAMFGGAERVVRAGVGLLEPLTRGLVARLRVLREQDGVAADRLTRQLILWLAVGATLAAAVVVGWAGVIVRVLLGPEYEAAAPVLQRLAPLLPIIAVATALGFFAAVPRGHDRVLLLATGAGGVTNLVLALPLATRFGAEGMAVSVVLAESVVVGILAVWYLRQPPLRAVPS